MSQTNLSAGRLPWLDMAKGYGILFVIFTHLCPGQILSDWLFSFHMPLFFFLSGYVFRAKGSFAAFAKKKARGLLIPYFTLALPMILTDLLVNPDSGGFTAAGFLNLCRKVLLQQQLWAIWYLTSLFLISLAFYGLVRLLRSEWALACAAAVLAALGILYARLGGPIPIWNLDLTFTAMPFFCAGYLCSRHGAVPEEKTAGYKGLLCFLLLGLINLGCFLGSRSLAGSCLDLFGRDYGFPLLSYPAAFAGIGCTVLFARLIRIRPIEYIGRNSMLYFAWHQTILMPLVALGFQAAGIPREFPRYLFLMGERLAEMAVILLISTGLHILISRSRLKFLLGK